MLNLTLYEWTCKNCGTVFYVDINDKATCPCCGVPAERLGRVAFILRNEEFEGLVDEVIAQECSEGCWVHEEVVSAENVEEVEAVIGECAIARLRKALYGSGCPVKG